MAFASLGKQIDIHTGGIDHIPTHHNGEIAQAEAATGKEFSQFWMHNAFITLEEQRIGKSVGNAIGLRQVKQRGYSADAYRYWMLMGHYRSPMNFTFEALDGAKQALFRLKRHVFEEYKNAKGAVNEAYNQKFTAFINDDLDTPKAIALMWELIKDDTVAPGDKVATLKHFDTVLAIGLSDDPDDVVRELGVITPDEIPDEVQALLEERELARTAQTGTKPTASERLSISKATPWKILRTAPVFPKQTKWRFVTYKKRSVCRTVLGSFTSSHCRDQKYHRLQQPCGVAVVRTDTKRVRIHHRSNYMAVNQVSQTSYGAVLTYNGDNHTSYQDTAKLTQTKKERTYTS